jgi:ATP phosphoribosyltransferase
MNNNLLRVAIQKSGKLYDESIALILECGIRVNRADNKLKATANNFPIELLYLRDDDIPEYVQDGVADIGIVGENIIIEKERNIEISERLGFAKCRLSIAVPEEFNYKSTDDLNGLRIATTYPKTLSQFLDAKGVKAEIIEISGSTEIAPSIGLSEAVCDLVSSGSTLLSNILKEVEGVLNSEAVLIRSKELSKEKLIILEKLIFRIRSVQKAKNSKYIHLNVPNNSLPTIISLLPGLKSPTVLPLAETGWSSVRSVIDENDFWNVIENLKEAGAQGILVIPIEKMIGES